MNTKERQELIIDLVEKTGVCSYQELEKLLEVSNMTIRRDVDRLAAKMLVIKTLGGIQKTTAPANFYETSLLSRLSRNHEEKVAIALEALKHIKPQQTIYLDGSSTCLELAKLLAKRMTGLTIVTNSALTYMELIRGNKNTIVCIGGHHDPTSLCLTGPISEENSRKYFGDIAFLSTKGFLPEEGTFESSVAVFRIKQIMAKQFSEVILLVDHSKFGQRALSKVLDISEINTVITDENTPKTDISTLKKKIDQVFIV